MSIKEINDTFSIWAREYQKMPEGEEKKKFKVQMDLGYNTTQQSGTPIMGKVHCE